MRLTFFLFLFLLFSQPANSQQNFYSGAWETFSSEFHTNNPNGRINVNSLGKAKWEHAEGFFLSSLRKTNTGCVSNEESINNYSSFTLSLTIECASSDTVHTFNLTSVGIGSPYLMFGYTNHVKSLKNNMNMDLSCFQSGKCIVNNFENFLRNKAVRTVIEDDLFVGSSSINYLSIEEVRFTENATEVLLVFESETGPISGTLHPPGADFAFFLRDLKGNQYNLLSQFGWNGSEKNSFGSMVIDVDTEHHMILFFEPAPNPASINNLSLIEGVCESNCWNFYDIRLKD